MNSTDKIQQIWILAMIGLITIMSTYIIVDYKTSSIPEKIIASILAIEYDKVWWIENYVKINEISKKQIVEWLKQYNSQWWSQVWTQSTPATKTQTIQTPAKLWKSMDIYDAKRITWYDYVLWNPDAEITWVEYSDLECPYCKKLHLAGTIDDVIKAYDWKVNFVFKQFPLKSHANAPKEHEAALCAWELGWADKYYKYINTIFERTKSNGRGYSLDNLIPLAVELWLNESEFQTCLNSGKYSTRVQVEMAEWSTIFWITWTPGNVLINNKTGKWDKLPWAYPAASFKQKIDSLLQ